MNKNMVNAIGKQELESNRKPVGIKPQIPMEILNLSMPNVLGLHDKARAASPINAI